MNQKNIVMAKKSISKKYVKLGPRAGGFTDPFSRFKILRGQIKELVTPQERSSGRIKAAIRGGHLQTVSEKDYQDYLEAQKSEEEKAVEETKEPTLEEKLDEKTNAGLLEYYKDHYEVTEEQIDVFEKLKHDDRVAELVGLAEDSEEE